MPTVKTNRGVVLGEQRASKTRGLRRAIHPIRPKGPARALTRFPTKLCSWGHFHRWFLVAPDQAVSWYGEQPIALEPDRRYLIGVHAVVNGRCLIYDTKARVLTPFDH